MWVRHKNFEVCCIEAEFIEKHSITLAHNIMHLKAKVDDRILPSVCLSVPGFYVLHLQIPEVLLRHIALDQLAGWTRSHHFGYNFLELIVVRVGDGDFVLPME